MEATKAVNTMLAADSSFLKACRREAVDATPVWFMRQAGRYLPEYRKLREKYDFWTLCKTPELAALITLQPIKILNVDAAILFSDLLVPLEPMGISVRFTEKGPVTIPVASARDVEALRPVKPKESFNFVLSTIGMVKQTLDKNIPLIGFAGAPFTIASYALEGGQPKNFLKTKNFMHQESAAWHQFMQKLTTVITDYLLAQIEAGVSAVQLFDSWAGVLSPEDYREYALPYSASILQAVSKAGAPTIHFGTGTAGMLNIFGKAGGDVVGIDWRIGVDDAWKMIGENKAIQGNLDPATLLAPKPILKKEVETILQKAAGKPGHIFNLGHGVLPETPVDNVKAVIEWVKTYRTA